MRKTLIIAKWEYIEKIRTRAFIISMFVTPAILLLFTLAPTWFNKSQEESTRAYGIIDTSGVYFNQVKDNLEVIKLKDEQPKFIIINLNNKKDNLNHLKKLGDRDVISNKLQGYLIILNGGTDSIRISFRSKGSGSFDDKDKIESVFNKVKNRIQLEKAGVDTSIINSVSKSVNINSIKIEENGKESKADFLTLFFSSFIFIMLLMMMVLSTGGMLVRSLLEEKSNRLIEILVSSCSKKELLAGKVIALSALGFTQIFIWSILGLVTAGAALVPAEAFDNILPMMGFFILGYVFYVSIFVGIGSIVTTEQEAQQMTSYISLILILPTIFAVSAIQYPGSTAVKILSYIPFTSASIMMMRLKIETIPIGELLTIVFIMLVSIYLSISFSSKLFKIGILSYGKRPAFKELIRWIREK
ncbi:MAG: ABC transporter permease [Ignavibacteriaceae bacterium]|nr:ABC transporter permease [Ignavibacteriaceae bacterium]